MKKITLLGFIFSLLLFSCQHAFYRQRQYAGRQYIKTEPGTTQTLPVKDTSATTHGTHITTRVTHHNPVQKAIQEERKNTFSPAALLKKTPEKKKEPHKRWFKKPGKVKKGSLSNDKILNVLSLIISILSIGLLIAFLLFSTAILLFGSFTNVVILFAFSVFSALAAMILGLLGILQKQLKKGLGIAGLVIGTLVFIALMVLFFGFVV